MRFIFAVPIDKSLYLTYEGLKLNFQFRVHICFYVGLYLTYEGLKQELKGATGFTVPGLYLTYEGLKLYEIRYFFALPLLFVSYL